MIFNLRQKKWQTLHCILYVLCSGYAMAQQGTTHRSVDKITIAKIDLVDSVKLPDVSLHANYFDLIKAKSPVIGFAEGIYMPNEKLWYFKMPDSTALSGFAFSHIDTSLYIFYDYKSMIYLKNYKNDVMAKKQIISNLLMLDNLHSYKVYPVGRLKYFLLAKDSISRVIYCTADSQKLVLKSKESISSIIPLNQTSFIACYRDKLYLYLFKQQKGKILFTSPVSIISSAVLPNGASVIATSTGVFIIKKDFTVQKCNLAIRDGILKCYNGFLYVLSNSKHVIYRLKPAA